MMMMMMMMMIFVTTEFGRCERSENALQRTRRGLARNGLSFCVLDVFFSGKERWSNEFRLNGRGPWLSMFRRSQTWRIITCLLTLHWRLLCLLCVALDGSFKYCFRFYPPYLNRNDPIWLAHIFQMGRKSCFFFFWTQEPTPAPAATTGAASTSLLDEVPSDVWAPKGVVFARRFWICIILL